MGVGGGGGATELPTCESIVMGPGLALFGEGQLRSAKYRDKQRTFVYQNASPRPPLCSRFAEPSSAVSPRPVTAGPCTRKAISTIHSSASSGLTEKTAPCDSGDG